MGVDFSQQAKADRISESYVADGGEPSLGFANLKPDFPKFDTDWLAGGVSDTEPTVIDFSPSASGVTPTRERRLSPTEILQRLRAERKKTAMLRERQRLRELGKLGPEGLKVDADEIEYEEYYAEYGNEYDEFESIKDECREVDSARVFFAEPEDAVVIEECAPRIDNDEFLRRRKAVSFALTRYIQPLINRIEEQTSLLIEKDREIKRIEGQLKLLPDFQKQARERDEEAKLKHFESEALKKQMKQMESDQVIAEKVTKLSNTLIRSVEKKAEGLRAELEDAKKEAREKSIKDEEYIKSLREEVNYLRQPWWRRLFA